MKIGIDCRMFGPKHTGIGRYVQNLVENLLAQDKENEYVLFVNNSTKNELENLKFDIKNSFKIKNLKFKIVPADIEHYSLREQIFLPGIIKSEKPDLMHFPHFNVPVLYRGKYIVTIHDLIKHTSRGMGTTTRSPWLYWLKYLGYKFVFKQAVKRAEKIITPSQSVKNEVVKQYEIDPGRVVVTYEGADNKFKIQSSKFKVEDILERYEIKKPYLLYVGSVYPHKNIEKLIEAVKLVNEHITYHISHITLVIVCARNVFIERLSKFIEQNGATGYANLVGFVPDEELAVLYKEAEAFVFPTLSEGFGLPGLEAMSIGCPVLCSDIPVLREVYKEAAIYFNPFDPGDMADKIKNSVGKDDTRNKIIKKGLELVKGYSWEKTARETLDVYNSSLR